MDEQAEGSTMVCISGRNFICGEGNRLTHVFRQMSPFTNDARSDGLILRHWQRQPEPTKVPALEGPEMDMEEDKKETEEEEAPKPPGKEYPFAKYNVKARLAHRYSDEEYNRHLKSNDWSREETDYLMDLVEEYGLRWVVIADRYDFQPQPVDADSNANALVSAEAHRTMEQMKSRYYSIAATMLALEHPPSEMSEAEFELHEKMLKFDPDRERLRKELASLQLNRTADEVREEGILLEELKRITSNEQNFIAERRELYSRLEVPMSVGNTTMYQSSQGLSQLLSTLLQADKSKKRRSLLGPEGAAAAAAAATAGGAAPSPAGQTPTTAGIPNSGRDSQADTPSQTGPSAAPTKKAAAAAAAASNKETQPLKTLTPAEEAKYGVQHHERLTPSVQFRTDRAQKLTQAKSNVQSQKLAAALAELEIPLRLVMPTERVCKEFESLIQSVNLLLDARKTAEKVEGEIRVLQAAKEDRERKEKGTTQVKTETVDHDSGIPQADGGAPQADDNDESTVTAMPGDGNEAGDSTTAAAAPGGSVDGGEKGLSHKRSASVMSNGSDKSTKRQRK